MPITPVGGMIYANQNMQVAASKQTDFQNRLDVQNTAAAATINEKEKEIEEVRPPEETYKIDPEHEHDKEGSDEETGEKEEETLKEKRKNEKKQDEEEQTFRKLDIKV